MMKLASMGIVYLLFFLFILMLYQFAVCPFLCTFDLRDPVRFMIVEWASW